MAAKKQPRTPRRAAFCYEQFTTMCVNGLERKVYMAGRTLPVFTIVQRWGKGAGWWVKLPNRDHFIKGRHKSIRAAVMAGAEYL